jgi:hypothetical protein
MPPHAVAAEGAAFDVLGPALAELGNWFASGHHALMAVTQAWAGCSEVRCWPHHFDLDVVIELEPGHREKLIGVGLSPGDEHYAEPYFYVSPYPKPEPEDLPTLVDQAHWHTEGFVSAILPASRIPREAEAAVERVAEYLDETLRACAGLLGH